MTDLTIHSIFSSHFDLKATPGLYGLEVETEVKDWSLYPQAFKDAFGCGKGWTDPAGHTHTKWPVPLQNWDAMDDGSLRNFGVEYVLKKPLSYHKALDALAEFKESLKDVPFIKGAPATSVHVHMNMLNETPLTLANVIFIWQFFENVLVEYCGPTRRTSLFSVPTRAAEGIKDNYTKLFFGLEQGSIGAISFPEKSAKYCALNLATLTKFGSLEFRTMRGTTDTEEIAEWLSILNKIYLMAKVPGMNPDRFLELFNEYDISILDYVFDDLAVKLKTPHLDALIDRSQIYVLNLAQSVASWETFGMAYMKVKSDEVSKAKVKFPKVDLNHLAAMAASPSPWADVSYPLGASPTLVTIDEAGVYPDDLVIPDFDEEEI